MADTTIEQKIYFAGFFDGEGCVAMYPKSRTYYACLTNTQTAPLLLAASIWGGYISRHAKETRKFAILDLWRWTTHGHKARQFLEDIRPYALLKAEQIDVYLNALDHIPTKRGTRRQAGATEVIEHAAARLRLLKREVA